MTATSEASAYGDPALPASAPEASEALRSRVEAHLADLGFRVADGRLLAPVATKPQLRKLHAKAVLSKRERAERPLRKIEPDLIARLARGQTIDPSAISPELHLIVDKRSEDSALFRWASLHWSIPVSAGYGRRLRFLVTDRAHNDSLIGIIGLGDPVFSLRPRDEWVGWTLEERKKRLVSAMDAFVLGAVPPYSELLGGKLVASLATSVAVRRAFENKYGNQRSEIRDRVTGRSLLLITTTSALGRSSVYNRLRRPSGELRFKPVGYTAGSGDFHLSGDIYEELAAYAHSITADGENYRADGWSGTGFRNRRETLSRALSGLGFQAEAMRLHGVRRQVFVAPLASNSQRALRSSAVAPDYFDDATDEIADWWKERWGVPRAGRTGDYREFDPSSWRLWQ